MQRATGGNPDIFMNQQPTPQQAKEAIAAYYACVSFVDDNIGMVLDALKQEGLDKNTIVVFLGDHGFHLGDHGCWSKYSMLEATRRVPFIVRVPGAPANGKVCREFVEFVDLVPTLGELVKLDLPGNLEGTSFVPLLVNPDQPWKKAVFMVDGDGGQMVRTRPYSYLELKKGPVPTALYDLEKDPWEVINVVDDPAYAKVRQEMAGLLKQGWQAALPPGHPKPAQ
jgi:arylsulfatase A-like enzyme